MKDHLLMLADYHTWAFEVLYGALRPMSDTQYRADAGLFFRSIHGTLNHLLLGDCVWYGRFSGEAFEVSGLDAELESERGGLERAIRARTARWKTWIAAQGEERLAGDLVYSNLAGTRFVNPVTPTLLHVFNHGTHHRGQISAAVSGFGRDVPEMDLIRYLRERGA